MAQEYALAHTKVLKMIVTRWLSRGQCVARIFELYRPLLAELVNVIETNGGKSVVAETILEMMLSQEFVTSLVLMHTILTAASDINGGFFR